MSKITEIDKNFVQKTVDGVLLKTFDLPCAPFDIYGVFHNAEKGRFERVPEEIATATNDGVAWLAKNTAGGRVKFSTDSKRFYIKVTYESFSLMSHFAPVGSCGFSLLEEYEDGRYGLHHYLCGDVTNYDNKGFEICVGLPNEDGKMSNYILFMPTYNDVKTITLGVDENCRLEHGKKYKDVKPVLYYGSSITQGGCVCRPDDTYQAVISKWTDTDYINLGFSGSALAEDVMVDYLTTFDPSIFVCDYDHNAPNAAHLENTHERLYERYRAVHPTTPIVFVTKPDKRFSWDYDRCEVIKRTYDHAVAKGDKNVWFIDGGEFYANDKDYFNYTVDGCHPNTMGFYRMAQRIQKTLEEISDDFKKIY